MKKQTQKENDRSESLFDRWCREERTKKFMQNDVLFFGLTLMLAFYATQNVLTIQ